MWLYGWKGDIVKKPMNLDDEIRAVQIALTNLFVRYHPFPGEEELARREKHNPTAYELLMKYQRLIKEAGGK